MASTRDKANYLWLGNAMMNLGQGWTGGQSQQWPVAAMMKRAQEEERQQQYDKFLNQMSGVTSPQMGPGQPNFDPSTPPARQDEQQLEIYRMLGPDAGTAALAQQMMPSGDRRPRMTEAQHRQTGEVRFISEAEAMSSDDWMPVQDTEGEDEEGLYTGNANRNQALSIVERLADTIGNGTETPQERRQYLTAAQIIEKPWTDAAGNQYDGINLTEAGYPMPSGGGGQSAGRAAPSGAFDEDPAFQAAPGQVTRKPLTTTEITSVIRGQAAMYDLANLKSMVMPSGEVDQSVLAFMSLPRQGFSENAQKAYNSLWNIVEIMLRNATGAATNPDEIKNYISNHGPRYGDRAGLVKQKLDRIYRQFSARLQFFADRGIDVGVPQSVIDQILSDQPAAGGQGGGGGGSPSRWEDVGDLE